MWHIKTIFPRVMKVDAFTVCLGNWQLCVCMYIDWNASVMVREIQIQASSDLQIKTVNSYVNSYVYILCRVFR